MNKINTIIWDWNGTLLDDLDICIETINELLHQRKLPEIDKTFYLDVFGFPVKEYYQRIGFNFEQEPFDIPAHQYIESYKSKVKQCQLHQGVVELLQYFSELGFIQLILSASEQQSLEENLNYFGIRNWFTAVAGLDNHFAQSKKDIGVKMLNNLGIHPSTCCLIGDTTHDAEVAQAMGCQCILLSNGHQNAKKLLATGVPVVSHPEELKAFFKR
ncbi:MAG: HAD family hydrolase [Prolixibacteraceae bacterium]